MHELLCRLIGVRGRGGSYQQKSDLDLLVQTHLSRQCSPRTAERLQSSNQLRNQRIRAYDHQNLDHILAAEHIERVVERLSLIGVGGQLLIDDTQDRREKDLVLQVNDILLCD